MGLPARGHPGGATAGRSGACRGAASDREAPAHKKALARGGEEDGQDLPRPLGRAAREGLRGGRPHLPGVLGPDAAHRLHRPAGCRAPHPRAPEARLDRAAPQPCEGGAGAVRPWPGLRRSRHELRELKSPAAPFAAQGSSRLRLRRAPRARRADPLPGGALAGSLCRVGSMATWLTKSWLSDLPAIDVGLTLDRWGQTYISIGEKAGFSLTGGTGSLTLNSVSVLLRDANASADVHSGFDTGFEFTGLRDPDRDGWSRRRGHSRRDRGAARGCRREYGDASGQAPHDDHAK